MKKRLWFLIVPILLAGAIFWARDAAWKKTEADFRRDLQSLVDDEPDVPTHIYVDSQKFPSINSQSGALWNKSDCRAALNKIHLMRKQSKPRQGEPMIEVVLEWGASAETKFGFRLALDKDNGWINLPAAAPYDRWDDYEFTPETCRELKKHIAALRERKSDGELASPQ